MESTNSLENCGIKTILDIIGGKWKLLIIYYLLESSEPIRFSTLRRLVGGITEKMLTAQLRDLEAKGVVKRVVYPVVPPRVEYSLTPLGNSLLPLLTMMQQWGAVHSKVD